MMPKELELTLVTLDHAAPGVARDLRAHIAALEAERDTWRQCAEERQQAARQQMNDKHALAADNAALAELVQLAAGRPGSGDACWACGWHGRHHADCRFGIASRNPHPGAHILAEHAKALVQAENEGLLKVALIIDNAAGQDLAGDQRGRLAASLRPVIAQAFRDLAATVRHLAGPES